ncbi:MAG: glycosyltransferase family 4 protein [bacterium]
MFNFKKDLDIVFIGDFPPRICGIATFTKDLLTSVKKQLSGRSSVFAVAMNDDGKEYDYPKEVLLSIDQNSQKDYLEAANFINTSNAQVACLQHEFGIFGGRDGIYILSLLSKLNIPLVTTLHTVLQSPSPNQKKVMDEIIKCSSKLVVMSKRSMEILEDVYKVPESKIEMIYHGTPNFSSLDSSHFKKRFKLEGKKMVLTFGLLSPNKGIETVIKALPSLIKDFPGLTYVVLGKTHPHVFDQWGEKYRESLIKLVEKLKLRKHVIFDDRFVAIEELYAWLQASDIYVTPYMNKSQAVSGTLSYAIGAGNATISTPYWYAEEMLSDGRGYLFDFNDHEKLSTILRDLLRNEKKLRVLQQRTYKFGRQMIWEKVSAKYANVLTNVASSKITDISQHVKSTTLSSLPVFDLSHIKRITDDTGIIQHAKYIVPDRSTGYCLDDNARAIILAAWARFLLHDKTAKELLPVYCSFIKYMQKDSGTFINFLDYRRHYMEEKGSDDSNGRTIWALGYLVWRTQNNAYRSFAVEILKKTFHNIPKLNLRGKAFSVLGLVCYLRVYSGDEQALHILKEMSKDIMDAYLNNKKHDWGWFEDILCYDNAVLPMSLFNAYSVLKDEKLLEVAKESMIFLENIIFKNGILSIVGNEGWYKKGGTCAQFDQQPIDVTAVVLAYQSAYRVTHDIEYLKKMKTAFNWFLGDNDMGVSMYDTGSKGCSDGLMQNGPSMNQGAESTISFFIALLAMIEEYEIENLE